MFRQAPPSFPQISHWYWYVIGVDPVHVPGLAVTVLPTAALPVIVGSELFDGATADRVVAAPATPATPSPQTATAASTPRLRTIHFEKRTSLISTPSCLDQSSQPAWPLGRRRLRPLSPWSGRLRRSRCGVVASHVPCLPVETR